MTADFVVIGAGIIGLTIARELKKQFPKSKVVVFEKEKKLGLHSSGRNSGVLHSGIYYSEGSLKAKICSEGNKKLSQYCLENNLPIKKIGKIIVSDNIEQLQERGIKNNVKFEVLDKKELKKREPEIIEVEKALFCPDVAIIDSLSVLHSLAKDLDVRFGERNNLSYGMLVNAAGLHADKIAHEMGLGLNYDILPIKGSYYKLKSKIKINHLIYPVPNLNMPFIGIHVTKAINDEVYFGPSISPVFSRENYYGFNNINFLESIEVVKRWFKFLKAKEFRQFACKEGRNIFKSYFVKEVKKLIPRISINDLVTCDKVGIRPQLIDVRKNEMIMDFVIEKGKNSIHVLNAVSPGLTCSFAFAELVVLNILR